MRVLRRLTKSEPRVSCAVFLATGLALAQISAATNAWAADRVFTVGNYPVEAEAKNAVAAKQQAIKEGQRAALRSLLKRLVPVTRYSQLRNTKLPDAATLVDSVQVRSERNSSTEYVAELDIAFRADAVRQLLRQSTLPFVEQPAPETLLILIYTPPVMVQGAVPRRYTAANGARLWQQIWRGLDLKNSLTPLKITKLIPQIHRDTIRMVLAGEGGGDRILAGEYGTERVVIAELQPDLATKRLNLKIAGGDAVSRLRLKRAFRFDERDLDYHVELAAVIAHGILEGRWKSLKSSVGTRPAADPAAYRPARPTPTTRVPRAQPGPTVGQYRPPSPTSGFNQPRSLTQGAVQPGTSGGRVPVQVLFTSLAQWQQMRRAIESTPGVSTVEVNGLSPQSADLLIDYPRGGQALAEALAIQGLRLQPSGNGWLLR